MFLCSHQVSVELFFVFIRYLLAWRYYDDGDNYSKQFSQIILALVLIEKKFRLQATRAIWNISLSGQRFQELLFRYVVLFLIDCWYLDIPLIVNKYGVFFWSRAKYVKNIVWLLLTTGHTTWESIIAALLVCFEYNPHEMEHKLPLDHCIATWSSCSQLVSFCIFCMLLSEKFIISSSYICWHYHWLPIYRCCLVRIKFQKWTWTNAIQQYVGQILWH